MRIGFEAKRAFQNNTGLGQYSRTLVRSLASYFPSHEYLLFAPRQTNMFNTDDLKNISVVTPTGLSSTFKNWWRSRGVKKDLINYKVGLYHGLSHEIPFGIEDTGVKSIVTIHDLIFERYPEQFPFIDRTIYRAKFKYACEHADRVIAISKATQRDIVDMYKVPAEKIDICYQSCSPAFSQKLSEEDKKTVRKQLQLPDQFLLSVGSIIERKNLMVVCGALLQLKGRLDIPLVIIGDGGEYKKLVQEFVVQNGLEKQVTFLNDSEAAKRMPSFKNGGVFPAIYQCATAMIYPSYCEGFGIPVLEAAASGLPVITSNLSSLPEAGGDAAYLINPFKTEEMVEAIEKVATDTSLRNTMIEKGYRHAEKFSPQACAASVMKTYERVVAL